MTRPPFRRFLRRMLVILVPLVTLGCHSEPKRPNVLLISLDTLRADHLSCYGYHRQTSPFLDELAAKGVRYTNFFVNTYPTPSSHATILSGQYQETHRVGYDTIRHHSRHRFTLPSHLRMIQEILEEEGYTAVAVTDGGLVAGRLGFERGFSEYLDDQSQGVVRGTDRLLNLLKTHSTADRPVFAFYHTFEIHTPYASPEEYERMFSDLASDFQPTTQNMLRIRTNPSELTRAELEHVKAQYDAGIRDTDDVLKGVFSELQAIGFLENSLVMITSDHGEEFAEHGRLLHLESLYDEVLRVPMIVLGSDIGSGRVDTRMASSVDIVPTILEYVGIEADVRLDGKDLLGLQQGDEGDQVVISQFGNRLYSVRTHEWKFVENLKLNSEWLFNILRDPGETVNLSVEKDSVRVKLKGRLEGWKKDQRVQAMELANSDPSAETLRSLRTLGYVQGPNAPKSELVKRRIIGHIDVMGGSKRARIVGNDRVLVSGWDADTLEGAPVNKVVILVDGEILGETTQFFARRDVAEGYRRDDLLNCGWKVRVRAGHLNAGGHRLDGLAISHDGLVGMLQPLNFEVADSTAVK